MCPISPVTDPWHRTCAMWSVTTKEEKQVAIKLMCVDTLTRLLDNCSPTLDSDWETGHIEWYHWWTSNKQHREWICEEDLGWCLEEVRIMNWSGQPSHLWTDSILTQRISASSQSIQVLWVRYVTFSLSILIKLLLVHLWSGPSFHIYTKLLD